ncbi:MAG: enoyl-CoA hydratase/isomerase family protein [Bacteroidetes bacterium]|nr:enoyl-CoA hydratase/isomerase family protein [Bacteroidota bacterium]
MSEYSFLKVSEIKKGVNQILLNRPEKKNALNIQLLTELKSALNNLENDNSQRVVILKGAGNLFCAGLDLKEASDFTKSEESAHALSDVLLALYYSPLVTICAVQGAAIAGGCGIMTACDISISSKDAIFGYPEVKRGIIAALVMSYLIRQVGEKIARELLLTAKMIDSTRALEIGLLNKVVEEEKLSETAENYADQILLGGTNSVVETKKFMNSISPTELRDDVNKALSLHKVMRKSNEASEGINAFLEKRKPSWGKRSS